MTLRFIKRFCVLCFLAFLLSNCGNKAGQSSFSRHFPGYYYQLLAFSNDSTNYHKGYVAHVSAAFETERDSVFYDSENDLKGNYFVEIDSTQTSNFLNHAISRSSLGDSVCLLIKPEIFFKQQFKSSVPDFCINDSSVKICFKIKRLYKPEEFENITASLLQNETQSIESFFGSTVAFETARDTLGFYWVDKPEIASSETRVKAGDAITINYEGSFLNGRVVDISPPGFQLIYGTPDQVLKGLNYVIGRLKMGQTSKIILPSQLAFGKNGSSNGSIPPFTPMIYKITVLKTETK